MVHKLFLINCNSNFPFFLEFGTHATNTLKTKRIKYANHKQNSSII